MPPAKRSTFWIYLALIGAVALCVYFYRARTIRAPTASGSSVSLAVLGDSDSHAYHDSVFFPPGSVKRGGAYRATPWQWTELLQRLRGRPLEQGVWGVLGSRGAVARANRWLGRAGRSPPRVATRPDR